MNARRLRPALTAGFVLAAIVTLTGCGAVHDLVGGSDVPEGETDVFSISVGDCLVDSDATEVSSVPVVDCTEPHDYEAYLAADMDGGDFPGDDAIAAFGDETCGPAFETFVGAAVEDTSLDWTYFSPLEDGWANGDHEILCLVGDTDAQVSRGLAGAGPDFPLE